MAIIDASSAAPQPPGSRPLTVIERSIYRGPNIYSARPMIRIQIDLGELESWPTNLLPCFTDRLLDLVPSLAEHGCSYAAPSGFVRRLRQGTWLGHVIEHVALELQCLAGAKVTRGKTRSVKGRPGVYDVLYSYGNEEAGIAAGAYAIALVASLLPDNLSAVAGLEILRTEIPADPGDMAALVAALSAKGRARALGPTTAAIVAAARRRGIQVTRLDDRSLIQFGQGSRQKRIRASITGDTSLIGAEIAANKDMTKRVLADLGLPVPKGLVARSAEEAVSGARRLRKPVVVKPLDGNQGRGITTGLTDPEAIAAAYALARQHGRAVIVEEQLPGSDHRILVVGGKVVAVAERLPAHVIGDGKRSIAALIAQVNRDPRRGKGHEKVLTRIVPDEAMRAMLERDGLTLESVPAKGREIRLRDTANLSTGGTAIDRTEEIHPYNAAVAVQAAAQIGLDVCGIDFLSPDIRRPVSETGGGIVEVNAAPGFRMHLEPSSGSPRNVGAAVMDAMFPRGRTSRIPIFAVTGTNGKSTTVRMCARILQEAGFNVGMTTTCGIYFNGQLMTAADASGPRSARAVLANAAVDVAVLETARGGILREGLGFDRADVGAVLNVTADHLGLKGIETLEQLADVKAVVAENVARRGHSVLNADDPMCVRIARHAGGSVVWFTLRSGADMPPAVARHIAAGGLAVTREPGGPGGLIALHRDGRREFVIKAADIPATLGGSAEFNIANALAATAMCAARGIPLAAIRRGLRRFSTSFADSPGRMNIRDIAGMRVIVDYAHNAAAFEALGSVVAQMRPAFRRVIGMVAVPGDRRECDIVQGGRMAAEMFDEVIFRETPDNRGKPAGSICALMAQGAMLAGIDPDRVHIVLDEMQATEAGLGMCGPGDLLVLLPTQVNEVWRKVAQFTPAWHNDEPVATDEPAVAGAESPVHA